MTSAAVPRRSEPPGSLNTRAGAHDMRSISTGKSMISRCDEPGDVHGERRLEPDDPVRRVGELALLLVVVVRRVVGGDEIDRSVAHRLLQRGDVVRRAQRRIHLRVRVVALDRVFRERDVVRAHLRRDVDVPLLAPANQLDRSARAHVAEVHVPPRAAREQDVADRHDLFRFGRNSLEAEARAHEPSFIAPPCASVGSSQWSATGMPNVRAYSSAVRMRCALATGLPSSLTATAPAAIISPNSASDSPLCPTEIAPIG